ncbi:unnamed protein product [Allacma fusca]|uniref:Peptidase M3A/M3B catalytic domain-containing protein n=1 Tax=Allacma fusca TaxID=39272 RepID=A0A8J2JZ73_9HEXA|nr:unnamed protein product [Allacma fusca]
MELKHIHTSTVCDTSSASEYNPVGERGKVLRYPSLKLLFWRKKDYLLGRGLIVCNVNGNGAERKIISSSLSHYCSSASQRNILSPVNPPSRTQLVSERVGNFPQFLTCSYFSSVLKSSSLLSLLCLPNYSARFYSSGPAPSTTSSLHAPNSVLKESEAMTVNNGDSDPEPRYSTRDLIAMKPHGVQHNWDLRTYTPKDIEQKCADIIEQLRQLFDKTASAETLDFNSVLKPLLEAHRYSFTHGAVVTFPRHVADSPTIRDAASQATKLLDESSVEMSMRKDVFDKLVEYRDNYSHSDNLSPEYQRCLDRLIHTGRRNGLHLSEDVREKVKAIKKQVSELTLQFSRNLGEENTVLLFSAEELEGMPATFLEGLEKDADSGKYKVSLKYPHFFPVTRKCRIPETRKKLEIAYQSKCIQQNTRLLEEVLELRQREAELLGYANHAAYAQDMQMAKHPDRVKTFLTDLAIKLQPLWKAEKQTMLELKKRECEKYNFEYNDKLEMWDFRYYMCLIEEENYAVDQQLLMGYFPLEVVTKGMLGIYEDLLGLQFTALADAQKWHDDVEVYQVNDRSTSELMGYFYLDLFPREGKFGHACCVPLQPGCLDVSGVKQPAVSAMLTNFTRPKKDKPSLLDHKEVETYFHEFGHLMHTICSRAKSALLFGTRVETDFLEAPSQMLENWVWEREPLRRMSLHYETKTPLPDDIIDKLAASQVANAGGLNLRQIVLATFDQRVHLQGRSDTQAVYAQTLQEIMGLDAIPGTNMPANFNHLCIGYSGRYYSYLWSEVFSMDICHGHAEEFPRSRAEQFCVLAKQRSIK